METANTARTSPVLQQLKATKSLVPTAIWLNTFLSSQRSGLPTNTLVQTASFRILNSDIKTCLDQANSPTLPTDIVNATVKEKRFPGPLVLQVLDIEDMSRSRWSQIEEMEAEERGEMTKGREIIRIAPSDGDEQDGAPPLSGRTSAGPHKLLLEDSRGTKIYAVELTRVEGVHLGMGIGSKLVLRDTVVARGVILLDGPPKTTLLGGKVDSLHTAWCANRKEQLQAAMHPATDP